MVLVEKWPFFQLLFVGNISQENILYHLLERKKAFLSNKKKEVEKVEKWAFLQTG